MYWNKLDFGKHKGESLPEIILNDPDYFIWCMDEKIFDKYPEFEEEAESLWRKIRSIKIPYNEENNLVADYKRDEESGELFQIVISSKEADKDKSLVHRAGYLDLTFAHYYSNEQRSSAKKIMSEIFKIIFREMKSRPSLIEFEEFLSNEDNFGDN